MDALRQKERTPQDLGPRASLLVDKHVQYIVDFALSEGSLEHILTEHFKMSGIYWSLTALYLLGALDRLDRDKIIDWVLSCQHACGGFGASERHDPHLLYTLSAVQILALYDRLDALDAGRVAAYVAGLQREDGAFAGDGWGEVDTRFSYCAISCCSLLGRLDAIDVPKAVEFVLRCGNFDGGFGATPGNESHSGQMFTAVGVLKIAGAEDRLDADLTCWWLSERQTPSGGLNGRPEKLQDVCYSWWCLSCLHMLGRGHWIDEDALSRFILHCQDEERGGISDRPDDMVDVFHTFFGVAGLSLMGHPGLKEIDPVYALPVDVVERVRRWNASQTGA